MRYTLKAEPNFVTVPENGTAKIKLTAFAEKPTDEDFAYFIISNGENESIIPVASKDKNTFEVTLEVANSDFGVMKAYCFSHTQQGKLGLSNTVQFTVNADFSGINFEELAFTNDSGTIFVNAGDNVELNLYAKTSDGNLMDVSSSLLGTKWSIDNSEIAQVNDDGTVTGLKVGTSELTAQYRDLTASIKLDVGEAYYDNSDDNDDEFDEVTPPKITDDTLPDAIIGQFYTSQLTASGTYPITWTHTGRLPAGLTLNESGLISGTPTKAGKSTFTAKAANDYGHNSQKFTLQVYEPVSISTASLKDATEGKNYSTTFKAKGTRQITWSAEGLPDGLSINARTGRISGKPTTYGTYSAKITATNGAGSLTKNFALTVKGIPPRIAGNLARAELNENYSSGLRLTAGSSPVVWSIEGTLPDGLTFDSETGIISGTPASYAKSGYKLTITATNDAGSKSRKSP